jgi:hypothetical protein
VRKRHATLAALMLSTGAAWADAVSPAPDDISVAIYHDGGVSTEELMDPANGWVVDSGLAMVVETREIDLPAGPSVIRFRGVASTMVPQTAAIDGLPGGVLEQNFDYDLLSPGSLLAKSIGATVHLIRTDPKTGKSTDTPAIVRSGPDGAVLDVGGKLEALHCSGLPERLVFDRAPDGLTDTPTLTVRTNAPAARHYKIRLSYLATGINWSADYVAHIRPGGESLDLSGWLTLANFGATGFKHIPIFAVAGRINAIGEDTPVQIEPARFDTSCWPTSFSWWARRGVSSYRDLQFTPVAVTARTSSDTATETVVVTGSRVPDPRALGDYKLYALPEPTDMPAHEIKQVQFLDLHDVPFTRVYRYQIDGEGGGEDMVATTVLKLRNRADAGLGKPLPEGRVAAMETGATGIPVFVGQAPIKDTPVDLPFEIPIGETFSVAVKEALVDKKTVGEGAQKRTQRSLVFEIANNRARPIAFELVQEVGDGSTTVLSESRPHTIENGRMIWPVALKPGEQAEIQLGFESTY